MARPPSSHVLDLGSPDEYDSIRIYGYIDGGLRPAPPRVILGAVGRHALPDAVRPRATGIDRVGVVCRAPTAAVHGQPPLEDARRRRPGRLAPRRDESILLAR